jgi:hypothetical protein
MGEKKLYVRREKGRNRKIGIEKVVNVHTLPY